MTIDISFEQHGMKITALIITNNTETHSALQEIPDAELEAIKAHIKRGIEKLTFAANTHRKRT